MQLEDLVGQHMLDGRGSFVQPGDGADEDARVMTLRIDGRWLRFQENPNDGYRSMLGSITATSEAEMPPGSWVTFEPRMVSCAMRPAGSEEHYILFGIDERTGLVLFEVGTDNTDDCYPSFVDLWSPEGCTPDWLAPAEAAP